VTVAAGRHPESDQHGHGHGHEHGHGHGHGHGPDYDEDHDHHDGEPDSDVLWLQDNVVLRSVGVDIGSATTQVAFSRLHLRRHAEDLTSRYVVVDRELVYDAGVQLTPYVNGDVIDAVTLGKLLDVAYDGSGWTPEDIDTGAVILTGEALRRSNAERIGRVVAERAGHLVCATAGHHMEALLAAYGSGAARRSRDEDSVLLAVDIGGGTTKLALLDRGRVRGTAAVQVGGRLVVVDEAGIVTRLEPGGIRHATCAGLDWSLGGAVGPGDFALVAEQMADVLFAALDGSTDYFLTEPLALPAQVDGVVVSGGVSAYLHGREDRDFGDLGPALAQAISARVEAGRLPGPLLAGDEQIRATVVGAGEHTVQLSGITGRLDDPEQTLPRRDLPVVWVEVELGDDVDEGALAVAVRRALEVRDLAAPDQEAVLAMAWTGTPRHARIAALARGLVAGLGARVEEGRVVYLMLDGDLAMTLGRVLADELGVAASLVVLDGIHLRQFDYVDLGTVRPISGTVPVVIKSLAFTPMDAVDPPTVATPSLQRATMVRAQPEN
jgi:ethanolamine utilization protein EutA